MTDNAVAKQIIILSRTWRLYTCISFVFILVSFRDWHTRYIRLFYWQMCAFYQVSGRCVSLCTVPGR